MTDQEIKEYLDNNNWSIDALDAFMNIFNTSPQIINKYYDFENHIMAIKTEENTFTFKWVLGHP